MLGGIYIFIKKNACNQENIQTFHNGKKVNTLIDRAILSAYACSNSFIIQKAEKTERRNRNIQNC